MDVFPEFIKPEEQRTDFIGRIQEQRQFLVVLQGLLAHQHHWYELAQQSGPDFDPSQAPGDDSYANIFLPHGIGGIGKSWLTRRCLTLATEIPTDPHILTLYDDVSLGAPVLEPGHLLDRLYEQLVAADYKSLMAAYWKSKLDTPQIVESVSRYQFENREQWDKMVVLASELVARREPEPGYHSYAETSIAYMHASGAESGGKDAATLAKAYDLLLERMQHEKKIDPAEAALFRNPPAAQAAHIVTAFKQIAAERPIVIGLDNLEIIVPLEPLIRDCLVLPTNRSPIIWILSGRYNLADERIVEINNEQRIHKGYRDRLGENPPVVWDMSIFGDADLRDYLQAEAERRRAPLLIDDELIEALKSTSNGVPLVVEMVADALFTLDREDFLRDFALDDKSLLASDRLDKITERFLRYCLTHPQDLERVQAMALLLKGSTDGALAAVWNLRPDEPVRQAHYTLRSRYAFVLPEGLHDAVYEFVRRQLRTNWQHNDARERLGLRAVDYYRQQWEEINSRFDDPALQVRDSVWQTTTRDLVNALLWTSPDEAVIFLLPRFVEGLGFDRPFSNGLLMQAEEFLSASISAFSGAYANLLHRMRVGMQDIEWFFDEPGEAMGAMLESLLQAPGLLPLHLSIIHLWRGNWLVEAGNYQAGLAAYFEADMHRPLDAGGLKRQLGKAFYELSSRFLWPQSAREPVASEPGLRAAQRAVELDPENGGAWFNYGVALDYLGHEEEAIGAYERAIAIKPRPLYFNNLGDVYDALERIPEAINAYQQALELDPTYSWPYHNLGQLYAERGDYTAALNFFQQAIEHHHSDKDKAVSWDDFGDANAALGNYDEAISAYQWAGVLNPRYAPPWYGLGNIYVTLGRYQEAINAYQRSVLLDPDNAQAHYRLGLIYSHEGEYGNAVAQLQQAIKQFTADQAKALAWVGLGDIYTALKQYPDALTAYQEALTLDPTQSRAWNSIGDVQRISDDNEAALRSYRQAVQLDPEYAIAWNNLAGVCDLLERDDEAIDAYQHGIELAPDEAWPYNNLGSIYAQRHDYQKAKTLYQQAIERHEDDQGKAISWNNLGDAHVALNHDEDAMEAYRGAITLAETYAKPYHNLAQTYHRAQDYEQAIPLYQQAIERHEQEADLADSWRGLAVIYRALEHHGEATEAYQKVVAFDPTDIISWNNLGDVYLALARYQEAGNAYRQAIKVDPDYAWPYHNLGLISGDLGAYDSALTLYKQAITRHIDDESRAKSWTKLGDSFMALNEPHDGVDAYQQAIKLWPDYAWPYHSLGQIYEKRGDYQSALSYYQQAIDRFAQAEKHGQAQSWNGLGNVHNILEQHDQAIKAYRQATQLDSALAAPWNSLGDIYRLRADHDQAIKSYQQAIKLDASNPHPYHNLALVYETLGDHKAAVTRLRQAIERYSREQSEQESISWNYLGNAHQALEAYDKAIEAYEHAIDLNDNYAAPWNSLGDIYATQERHQQAIEAYKQTIDLDPDKAYPWNSLGDIYHTLGQDEQAIETYGQAIRRNPTYAQPYHSLGQIDEARQSYESAISFYTQALEHYPVGLKVARGL